MVCRTTRYYRTHPRARRKKAAYDKKFNRKPAQRKKRSELIKHNREHDKKYGKGSFHGIGLLILSTGHHGAFAMLSVSESP